MKKYIAAVLCLLLVGACFSGCPAKVALPYYDGIAEDGSYNTSLFYRNDLTVYQAADYLGYGRMLPFLKATNAVFEARGIALPLPGQATITAETRLEKGVEAQGGCEPQLTAHAKGNMNIGNDGAFLTRVVAQCLPYIGYPRSLNAIACIQKAQEA